VPHLPRVLPSEFSFWSFFVILQLLLEKRARNLFRWNTHLFGRVIGAFHEDPGFSGMQSNVVAVTQHESY
jgi:hypothetical protein